MINSDIEVQNPSPATVDFIAERKASRYCMNTLVVMDIVHAVWGFITLLYKHSGVARRLVTFAIATTALSVGGIFFNIIMRMGWFVDFLTQRGLFPAYTDNDSVAKRELIINLFSMIPTTIVTAYGQDVYWDTASLGDQDVVGFFARFTVWLYVVKFFAFPMFIIYIDYKFTRYMNCKRC